MSQISQACILLPLSYATVFRFTSIYFVSSAILEQFETVDQAVDFTASASCLEDIKFRSVGCSESCNYSSHAIALPLRQIRFEVNPLVDDIMDWFCRRHPTPSVHTLVITIGNTFDVCNFIRHLGSALENLSISCCDTDICVHIDHIELGGGWSKCLTFLMQVK